MQCIYRGFQWLQGPRRCRGGSITAGHFPFTSLAPAFTLQLSMARRCAKTGRQTGFGNTRSHSLRHTRRSWKPNMQKKRVFDPITGTYKRIKVSTAYLRTLAKRMQAGKVA